MIEHPFEPVFNPDSKILILGSFPSVMSREKEFYYGHPQNRFWRVLGLIFGVDAPIGNDGKKQFLLDKEIALWDVIRSCDITGSGDLSIKNAVYNDINVVLKNSSVQKIFTNGTAAHSFYKKMSKALYLPEAVLLPSTSPANASYSLSRLTEKWEIIIRD